MGKRKNGFTLIELIAVLVILAILALIVTPLVMNIVKKAKDSANKRSVDAYGKSVELAVATYLLDNGEYPDTLDNLKVEYSGNEVICSVTKLTADGSIYLSECSVSGTEVKDSSTNDGWYHYGNLKSGAGESKTTYSIGDQVTYNGMNFYVIENSDENNDTVTLLKGTPLTVDEVNTYGKDHVNMYLTTDTTSSMYQSASDKNGYGGMAYYTSSTCGNGPNVYDGCINNYEQSEVKYVVDAWANDKLNLSDLKEDTTGYSVRLILLDELVNHFNYKQGQEASFVYYDKTESTPSWINAYDYWTMSIDEGTQDSVWYVNTTRIDSDSVFNRYGAYTVRPVVTLLKSSL